MRRGGRKRLCGLRADAVKVNKQGIICRPSGSPHRYAETLTRGVPFRWKNFKRGWHIQPVGLLMLFNRPSIIRPMINLTDWPLAAPELFADAAAFASHFDRKRSSTKPTASLGSVIPKPLTLVGGRSKETQKQSLIVACVALAVSALSACTQPVDCSGGNYRGGCFPGTALPAAATPAVATPAAVSPAAASSATSSPATAAPAGAAPAGVARGEPSEFADVDDKQCRSYGLTFGSRDYADCRIRLSAQHRGLDPNLGTTTPGSGSR